jgi:hypothetical protein
VPLNSVPTLFKAHTFAYTNAQAAVNLNAISAPSTAQTVNPIATPYVKVSAPTTAITVNFDLNTNYVGSQTLPAGAGTNVTATHGYMWFVEFIPNSGIFGSYTASQQVTFSVSLAFGGGTGNVAYDGGSLALGNNYNVIQFYTLDGINVKGRVAVSN